MSIEVSNIDHLGLVAGIIDEIGMEQKINQLLGKQLPEKTRGTQVVKGNDLFWILFYILKRL